MIRTGFRNSIADVPGIRVGHAEDRGLTTGTTVIALREPCLCAIDHRGGAVGARDTIALMPGSIGGRVNAICLSGGSAYGLDAAGGVMDGLRRAGEGFAFGGALLPIVPSAIIFALMTGETRDWKDPPWWRLGRRALDAADEEFALGNVGAGLGATAGSLKGGIGTASFQTDAHVVGALAVANPAGSTVIPGTDTFWAWMLERDGELGGQRPPSSPLSDVATIPNAGAPGNTTLVVVATDAALDRDMALRVAIMAQDGIATAIRPVHGPMDGDTVFVLSTGARDEPADLHGLMQLGALAADAAARAIARGVYEAETLAGVPSYRETHGRAD